MDVMEGFGPATRAWFDDAFDAPTPAQVSAWQAIRSGHHSLLIAPTGSGKTLAAFLQCIDTLSRREPTTTAKDGARTVSVLYVSPLKALAVDVERNLTAPLRGVELAAGRLGLPNRPISVGVRTGDTPAAERRRQLTRPPDILITTPESLFLILSSQSARILAGVETVIVDEVHALAGTKRGAHLAVSLERLDALREGPGAQRIGLSATVRPPERVAAFLAGDRPVEVVAPGSPKQWDLSIQSPLPDMTELALAPDPVTGEAPPNQSIWPHVTERIVDLVAGHRSTLCFVNSRRVAERLTSQLNEVWAVRQGEDPVTVGAAPAQVMAQSGSSTGRDPDSSVTLARAHHGSVSKERRAQIEDDLKSGRLPCVVATSSLELGIDMGAVDQVIQVSSPPSVASGLQRVGRAGHQVGAVSRGVVLPTHRGDIVEAAVVVSRMVTGGIEQVPRLSNPLDVLAQQLVSMTIDRPLTSAEAYRLVRRSDPFRELGRAVFDACLDMLTGRYPSEDWADLRPRLTWDRATDELQARPGARRLVTTSGGTIPDRGLFGVFLVGEPGSPGRRVGELDEEMVHESRVGDVFTLGTSSWRIHEITPHQVLVTPAPGQPGRLPFWHGDAMARPVELGRAIGDFTDELMAADESARDDKLAGHGLDPWARDNLLAHLDEQQRATGTVPGSRHLVVERFRDELGDWQVCIHSPLGQPVLQPWALVIEHQAQQRYGIQARAMATNDGILVRLPDVEDAPPGADLLDIDLDVVEQVVTDQVQGSALFAARFRECAARALLLPRLDPTRRTPLWRQRLRSAQRLQVAAQHPDFPIVLETLRECLEDVFDLPGLLGTLRDLQARRVRLVEVETVEPSPFARGLLFSQVGEFLYDGDQPLAERRLAAFSLNQHLLAELLGRESSSELLDEQAVAQVADDLARRSESTHPTSAEAFWDVVRTTGPLTEAEAAAVGAEPGWVDNLLAARRLARVGLAGSQVLVTGDDLGLLRDALGVPVPPGHVTVDPVDPQDALDRLVLRWLRTHVAVDDEVLAQRLGVATEVVSQSLRRLQPIEGLTRLDQRWWHPSVLRMVRNRTLALLRRSVEAVEPRQLARFLAQWHELDEPGHGMDALLAAVEQLAGHPVPASMLDGFILGPRVRGRLDTLLDEALGQGDVVVPGPAPIGSSDGWVQLWPRGFVLARPSDEPLGERAGELLDRLSSGGAWTLAELCDHPVTPADTDALWELFWAGRVSPNTWAPLRELSQAGAVRRPPTPRSGRRSLLAQLRVPRLAGPSGRWSLVPAPDRDERAGVVAASMLLGRHGVVTRGAVTSDPLFGSFSEAYAVLSAMEGTGAIRRGWFVEGLGAAQFALPGAVDRLREVPADVEGHPRARLLAACDPANPFGAALPWPTSEGHRPTRRAGALVVIEDGACVAYLERGARTLVTFADGDPEQWARALALVADTVRDGRLRSVTVARVNGVEVLTDRSWGELLTAAGFRITPQGYRLRH
ncbi:DEAD/DEAH box helicase [Aestuariimicrobium ganziense]|uniref:DEAD/DEAH box helicase n=1 Tax=Aestuariimicrobium ganziense TaxID=2773677 RepID=UPI00194439E8|nr:DEAD/DEAH box helicase [Aestuariimicrobium ganziense]